MSYGAQLGAAMALATALTACSSERRAQDSPASGASAAASAAAPATITVTAKDYSFDAPDTLRAGLTTMRLVNNGAELHHAQLVKLEDPTKTMADVHEALKTPGPPPSWAKFVGGPNAVPPGKSSESTSVLSHGKYVYMCFIPSADGEMHVHKGMLKMFVVWPQDQKITAELPASATTIKMLDYDYHLSQPLTPGRHTIRVENDGPQPHELALLRLAPGKTVADFTAWEKAGMKGPPPAEPLGGVVALDKGGSATFTADLTAGDYALMCFIPDSKDGKPHHAHGMAKPIKVG